ncbi:MAG TPA: hypothetical protein VGH38_34090, partial [Bryobacteraceae bacterium]
MKRFYFLLSSILFLFTAAGLEAQTLVVDKTTVSFSTQFGGSAQSQTLNVTSTSGSIPFNALVTQGPWLKVSPSSGTAVAGSVTG